MYQVMSIWSSAFPTNKHWFKLGLFSQIKQNDFYIAMKQMEEENKFIKRDRETFF